MPQKAEILHYTDRLILSRPVKSRIRQLIIIIVFSECFLISRQRLLFLPDSGFPEINFSEGFRSQDPVFVSVLLDESVLIVSFSFLSELFCFYLNPSALTVSIHQLSSPLHLLSLSASRVFHHPAQRHYASLRSHYCP